MTNQFLGKLHLTWIEDLKTTCRKCLYFPEICFRLQFFVISPVIYTISVFCVFVLGFAGFIQNLIDSNGWTTGEWTVQDVIYVTDELVFTIDTFEVQSGGDPVTGK